MKTIYTSRPTQRQARWAWDYFMERYPALKTTKRRLELGYSPNLDRYGPGWIMEVGHLEHDFLAWHGSDPIIYTALCGTIHWTRPISTDTKGTTG